MTQFDPFRSFGPYTNLCYIWMVWEGLTVLGGITAIIMVFAVSFASVVEPKAEEIDTAELTIESEIELHSDTIAFGHGSLWVSRRFDVVRIDASSNRVSKIKLVGGSNYQRAPAIGENAVWLADVGSNTLYKIDPKTKNVSAQIGLEMGSYEGSIGFGSGAVWVVTSENLEKVLSRIGEESGELEATVALPGSGAGVGYGFDHVWVTSKFSSELYKVDPMTNAVASTIDLDGSPLHLAIGEGAVWIRNELDSSVQRVDPATHAVSTIETGLHGGKGNIVTGGGYVWVLAESRIGLGKVAQIEPRTNAVVGIYEVDKTGRYIGYGSGSLWISGSTLRRVVPEH
jgi:virginiamycin B lyase